MKKNLAAALARSAPLSLSMVALASFAAAIAGCANKQAGVPPMSPVSTTSAHVASGNAKKAGDGKDGAGDSANGAGTKGANGDGKDGVTTQSLHLSESIAAACNLPRNDATPHFDFDSAQLPEGDREVLAAFAKCLAGPLKGKRVLLTGRTDARGEDEYNMSLGGTRSDSVKRYLIDLGVGDANIKSSSRGEIDATGTDEESYAKDRRVDIDVE